MDARRTRVGIWGVFGRGNFGNEATLSAFLQRLPSDGFEPVLFCEDPEAAASIHAVSARALGTPATDLDGGRIRRIRRLLVNRLQLFRGAGRAVSAVDAVVVAGTGGLERYGSGAFGSPFEIWSLAVWCRLRRRPFLLLDVGIEHLPRGAARYFARTAGRLALYRSYRDDVSRRNMVANGLRRAGDDDVVTDLAFGLSPRPAALAETPTVSFGVMAYRGRDADDGGALTSYLSRCREVVELLGAEGWRVRLLGGDEVDLEFASALIGRVSSDVDVEVLAARTADELVTALSSSHVTIASRYHTLIMSLIAGTPTLTLGYADKHAAMLDQLGLPDESFDIESFEPEAVARGIARLAADRMSLSARIAAAVERARAALDAQWGTVEPLLTRRKGRT